MPSPFKFLDAYTKADRAIFFGRDREIEEMYQKVFESKILLIYGISGTGKTSLINCGLANKFEDTDWLPVNVRRGFNISDSLWGELKRVAITQVVEEKERWREGGKEGKREEGKEGRGEGAKEGGNRKTRKSPPLQGGDLEGGEVAPEDFKGGDVNIKTFSKALQSIYLDHFKPIYLIFDQFEELFIFGSREEREEFIKIVKEVIDSDVQCKFIFSIREEYLASVTEFELTIPDFLSNRMRIEKMTHLHAIDVIDGPCKVHGIEVEEGFAEALLNKLNPDGKEVELTYLQVFLDKVYRLISDKGHKHKSPPLQGGDLEGGEVAPGDTEGGEVEPGTNNNEPGITRRDPESRINSGIRMTLSLLGKVGDVSDLLGSFLEEQIGELEDPDTGLMILKAFVSVKGTKRQITEEEIIDFSRTFGKPIEPEWLTQLVQRFVNLRILRDKDENGRYELRHDSLAATIYEKITLVEKELIEVRQFIENAYENYKRRDVLLAPDDLDYLKVYKGKLFVSKELEDFIEKSISAAKAKMRTLKRVTSFSIVALLVVIFLIGYYYYKKQDKTRAVDFSIQALLQKDITPQLSFQSAYQAYLVDSNNTISKKAIFDAFYGLLESGPYFDSTGKEIYPDKALFNFESLGPEIISASFSEDDKFITGFLKDSSACIWNKKGKKIISLDFNHPVLTVKISGNNQFLGVLCSDSIVYVYNLTGEKILNMKVRYHILHPEDVFQFSPDGKIIIHVSPLNEIIFTELPSGTTRQIIPPAKSDVNDIAISDDQHWLAAGLGNGIIKIWNSNDEGDYAFFRRIPAHNGSVWSVDFSENSMFILSASEDSSYCIWDLNGQKAYGSFDEGYPQPNRDPYCKASFRGKDMAIVLTAYSKLENEMDIHYRNILIPERQYTYYTRLDFSDWSPVVNMDMSFYIEESNLWAITDNPVDNRLTCFDYSPNGFYYALTNIDKKNTGLYYADHLNMKILQGSKPVFSNDGKYVICIENDILRLYPAETSEMIRLVFKEKIFGPINPVQAK